jgi:hypothetical protein
MASFAEYRLEKLLERHFPGYTIRSTYSANKFRTHQLRKRGRLPGRLYPIETAAKMTRDYVAKGMRKHLPWSRRK